MQLETVLLNTEEDGSWVDGSTKEGKNTVLDWVSAALCWLRLTSTKVSRSHEYCHLYDSDTLERGPLTGVVKTPGRVDTQLRTPCLAILRQLIPGDSADPWTSLGCPSVRFVGARVVLMTVHIDTFHAWEKST